jgi:hypothetical protein
MEPVFCLGLFSKSYLVELVCSCTDYIRSDMRMSVYLNFEEWGRKRVVAYFEI